MNTEQSADSGAHGVKWGLIIGAVYAVLVFIRYYFGYGNAIAFGLLTYLGFPVALVLLFISGRQLRKANGGYIEMRDLFKSLFISVLIFEAFYMLVTFIYLKFIRPDFFDKLIESTENLMIMTKRPQKEIDDVVSNFKQAQEQTKGIGILDILKTYLYSVGTTGLFALLFAFIIKRKPPAYERDNFLQP